MTSSHSHFFVLAFLVAACGSQGNGSSAHESNIEGALPSDVAAHTIFEGGPIVSLHHGHGDVLYGLGADKAVHRVEGDKVTPVSLEGASPASQVRIAAAPDRDALYVTTTTGIARSTNAGGSWSPVLTLEGEDVIGLAAGPNSTLYAGTLARTGGSGPFKFLRSDDDGQSWTTLSERTGTLCRWGIRLLDVDRTDPKVVYRASDCYAGRILNDDVTISKDGGATFAGLTKFAASAFWADEISRSGSRAYVRAHVDPRGGTGSTLLRTDDNATFEKLIVPQRTDAGPMTGDNIGALAASPKDPNLVFIGVGTELRVSRDGGTTFAKGGDHGKISALIALDSGSLVIASDKGIAVRPVR